jgi:predicted phage-related endonuclease
MDYSRQSYIGSHESAIIMGDYKPKSLRRLHEEKVGKIVADDISSVPMVTVGLYMEDFIIDDYRTKVDPADTLVSLYSELDVPRLEARSPFRVVDTLAKDVPMKDRNKLHFAYEGRDYFRGSPDCLVLAPSGRLREGVDAKVVFDWEMASELKAGAVPKKYAAQGRHFCKLTGLKSWTFHCLLLCDYGKFVTVVYRDDEMGSLTDKTFLRELDMFWSNVQSDRVPPFSGTEGKDIPKLISARYQGQTEREATENELNLIDLFVRQRAELDHTQELHDRVKTQVVESIGTDVKRLTQDGDKVVTIGKNGSVVVAPKFKARILSTVVGEAKDED